MLMEDAAVLNVLARAAAAKPAHAAAPLKGSWH